MSQHDKRNEWDTEGWALAKPEKLPPPTVWPATLSLGVTLLAFGVVTSWIMSIAGLLLFVLALHGWFEDLRNDVLQ